MDVQLIFDKMWDGELTKPRLSFPKDVDPDPATLAAGRYGTPEMVKIWGSDKTFDYSLQVQGQAMVTLSKIRPDIISPETAGIMYDLASIKHVSPARIRELERKGAHDIIALNKAWEEVLPDFARPYVNMFRTSADTTDTAKPLQLKHSLEVVVDSAENLRDILIEKSLKWVDVPFMDKTHLYDAMPTVAGRPLAHYIENISSGLKVIKFFYDNSLVGKWGDATGNHHAATVLGVDGLALQEEYCKDLGLKWSIAAAQVPSLEFQLDVIYSISRLTESVNNLANFIAEGRGDDMNVFINRRPQKAKGSSAMPHKDAKNGNPTAEEQFMSVRNYSVGNMVTMFMNCEMPYARNLEASSNSRINFEDGFKYLDHALRGLASIVYWIDINAKRSTERVLRSNGAVTSGQVLTYLTSSKLIANPMSRSEAHDIVGRTATYAYENDMMFHDALLMEPEVTSRIGNETLRDITDPLKYIGQSKEIVKAVAEKFYQQKTL